MNVAWDPFATTRSFDGNLNIAMFYNRTLTQTEMLQNFNAIKGRFGLT